MTKLDSILKSRDITLPTKYGFSSSHVWIWELDHKESWTLKNWCFWTIILEKTLENLLNSKELKSVNSKGNQSWIFIGRIDAEAEEPILWPPDAKYWLTGKRPWCWERLKSGEADNREWDSWMANLTWWTWVWPAVGADNGQGSLVCCSPWDCKESDTTDWTDWLTDCKFHLVHWIFYIVIKFFELGYS